MLVAAPASSRAGADPVATLPFAFDAAAPRRQASMEKLRSLRCCESGALSCRKLSFGIPVVGWGKDSGTPLPELPSSGWPACLATHDRNLLPNTQTQGHPAFGFSPPSSTSSGFVNSCPESLNLQITNHDERPQVSSNVFKTLH